MTQSNPSYNARTPVELELEARRQYLDGLMTTTGYGIVSELVRRLQQEGCHCLRVTDGAGTRTMLAKACPFHSLGFQLGDRVTVGDDDGPGTITAIFETPWDTLGEGAANTHTVCRVEWDDGAGFGHYFPSRLVRVE